jgi:hypothetical protein
MASGGHDGHLGAVYDARAPEEVAAVYDAWASTYDEERAKAGYRHPAVGLALLAGGHQEHARACPGSHLLPAAHAGRRDGPCLPA